MRLRAEAVHSCKLAWGINFEYDTPTVSPSACCPVEIAVRSLNHRAYGAAAIRLIKVVQGSQLACRSDLEDRATEIVRPSKQRSPVKIPVRRLRHS